MSAKESGTGGKGKGGEGGEEEQVARGREEGKAMAVEAGRQCAEASDNAARWSVEPHIGHPQSNP